MTASLDLIIMAAGKGTRMKSRFPKVLQRLAGRALLQHVLDQAAHLGARSAVVVTGHGAAEVEAAISAAADARPMGFALDFVRQEPQLGTGHAVQQAVPLLRDDGVAVVLSGDVPLTQAATLQALVDAAGSDKLALLTVTLPDPSGYGRIVRTPDGAVQAIVEHKDASEAQRRIAEIYSGIMAVPARLLSGWLARLTNDNAQGEYYLTDIVAMAVADGVRIGAYCVLRNARVDAGATIRPYTHIDGESLGASVGARAIVGPYARLRAGAVLGADVHVGNFVEIKNSILGDGAKANHLAYLGDSDVGARVNYGAGSITANYDGANKHRTTIGADAHIGSNCVLVAPVVVGAGATIGGGSTINKDAPAGELTVARARQATIRGWKRPVKR